MNAEFNRARITLLLVTIFLTMLPLIIIEVLGISDHDLEKGVVDEFLFIGWLSIVTLFFFFRWDVILRRRSRKN